MVSAPDSEQGGAQGPVPKAASSGDGLDSRSPAHFRSIIFLVKLETFTLFYSPYYYYFFQFCFGVIDLDSNKTYGPTMPIIAAIYTNPIYPY